MYFIFKSLCIFVCKLLYYCTNVAALPFRKCYKGACEIGHISAPHRTHSSLMVGTASKSPRHVKQSQQDQPALVAQPSSQPLQPLGVRLGESPFLTFLHLKEHRNVQAPSSLFVAGLPLGVGEKTLSQIVSCFGEPTQIVLHSNKVRIST